MANPNSSSSADTSATFGGNHAMALSAVGESASFDNDISSMSDEVPAKALQDADVDGQVARFAMRRIIDTVTQSTSSQPRSVRSSHAAAGGKGVPLPARSVRLRSPASSQELVSSRPQTQRHERNSPPAAARCEGLPPATFYMRIQLPMQCVD